MPSRAEPHRQATGSRGMVVCAHPLAAQAGIRALNDGGNAVDAAVATGMALAVVHPSAGNIGGGGFMLVRTADGTVTSFDFREKAPQAATAELFLDAAGKLIPQSNHEGHRAVGVPGTVAGFDLALRRFGKKSWAAGCAAAIDLAEQGFPLTPAMAAEFAAHSADWLKNAAAKRVFLRPDGSPFPAGAAWKQPELAATLRRIAAQGAAGFYGGETARLLAADMAAHGGIMVEADLASYQAKERPPVRGTYRGWEVISMGPPSSGGVALIEMLNLLEPDKVGALPHHSAPHLHLLAEVMRRAYADRARFLGDPDFNAALPLTKLLSKDHALALRRSLQPDKAGKSAPADVTEPGESEETTHFSVVDAAGNAVAVTYTLEYSYGARIVADGLGFLYNNEMGDFNPQPGRTDATGLIGTPPNRISPGKRMLSSMTPTLLVRDGKLRLVTGSPGGRTIINTVLQVVSNTVDFQMALPAAVAAGRIHHQWLPDEIRAEPAAMNDAARHALQSMGHTVRVGSKQGRVMAIAVDPASGTRTGVADPRDPDAAALAQ
ncbi:MAG: gamma-glutamyltransferase [Verrucomicrobiales bacterium]|nr:gamma-glutamyltransferase [Verrucomicrobiales bacterium]